MIALFPYKRLTIETDLSRLEASERLRGKLEARRSFANRMLGRGGGGFEAVVTGDGFKIYRQVNYRNSFIPTLYGRFDETARGTVIRVQMIMHPLVIAFGVLWICVVGPAAINSVLGRAAGGTDTLAPVALLVFFYVLTTSGFAFEAHRAEQFLNAVLPPKRGTPETGERAQGCSGDFS